MQQKADEQKLTNKKIQRLREEDPPYAGAEGGRKKEMQLSFLRPAWWPLIRSCLDETGDLDRLGECENITEPNEKGLWVVGRVI